MEKRLSNDITTYWTFIFLFLLILMYRGKYAFPLNKSIHNFFEKNRIIIYFLFIYTTLYIFSHSLNILIIEDNKDKNKLTLDIKYLTSLFFLSILFIMFCKCNIYCIFLILILIITIDIFNFNKLSYILPTLIIIVGFIYELIKYNGNVFKFLDN